ncbi:MAG: hypothetical protein RMI04_02105, partial [Thermofilaceae archaeon]|nr:hypothetical protein [Thermofilaceae archaeon]
MKSLTSEEKSRFLHALEEDREFRYAVAGLLGYGEVLKRLDSIEDRIEKLFESQMRLIEESKRHSENIERLWQEVRAINENQRKIWEEVRKHSENIEKLWIETRSMRKTQEELTTVHAELKKGFQDLKKGQEELRASVAELRSDVEDLKKGQEELRASVAELREGQEALRSGQVRLEKTVKRLSRTVERLTLTVEEEARDVIAYKLRTELGVDIKITQLVVEGREIDVYGTSGDLCVIGEATVRLGPKRVQKLQRLIEHITETKPELLKPNLIKVIYTDAAT